MSFYCYDCNSRDRGCRIWINNSWRMWLHNFRRYRPYRRSNGNSNLADTVEPRPAIELNMSHGICDNVATAPHDHSPTEMLKSPRYTPLVLGTGLLLCLKFIPINNLNVMLVSFGLPQYEASLPFLVPGGRFKNRYELLNLRALKISIFNKNHTFRCMGKVFCVEFQRVPLKFHTKYLTHTLKDVDFLSRGENLRALRFKSS